MMTELEAFTQAILTSGVAFRVGLMIAISMIIGYMIYEQTNARGIITKIVLVGGIFLLFEAWVTSSILDKVSHPFRTIPLLFPVALGVIFIIALSIGMYMARRVVQEKRRQIRKQNMFIEQIKANGTVSESLLSTLDVKTEPCSGK